MVTAPAVVVNLPWVEKYRPSKLDELVAHEEIVKTCKLFFCFIAFFFVFSDPFHRKTNPSASSLLRTTGNRKNHDSARGRSEDVSE